EQLKKEIGHMLILGFTDEDINENSQIVKDIQKYELGGVILFDRFYDERSKTKNISSPHQLQRLTKKLKMFAKRELFIAVDQEGGKVARLKPEYGFTETPSAFELSKTPLKNARDIYARQSHMLKNAGINLNFAPVVDLAINPKNEVIVALERSFGTDSSRVSSFAEVMIEEQRKKGVTSVLKHFPGHGSSLGDSHEGFVNISKTWSTKELEPYQNLIDKKQVDMIMTAHVFNKYIDQEYPATLSYRVNSEILREKMKYGGLIVSDDMQMKAISEHYSTKEAVTLAINAGVDILLFGNQLANITVDELVNTIFTQVKSGAIPYERILESNQRIQNLRTKNAIVQKPIIFTQKRKDMTKEYIKTHYGLKVKDIKIEPKMIVLHWTAVMDFDECFKRLNAEELYSDRGDIAAASALNVSAHFLVARDGTIYQLMPDNWMARHVIGLNYSTIGIENIGGEGNVKDDLTDAQLEANIKLVKYLRAKYQTIEHIIGHHEYREYEESPLWLEKDDGYRTIKADPGDRFTNAVRAAVDG
ncbi:MAG: glycoside hydrolase family 3 N-terminal domain-containing protein, partial [Campylobacterota bacterium]|nr:glycoside hydrolase family 3 N-terminal domain-containing protein [Campylobacterota bacterium]